MAHILRFYQLPFYFFLFIFFSVGCKKNEEFIVQQSTAVSTGIQLKINNDQVEKEAFGAQCSIDGEEIIRVTNNAAFLSGNVDPTTLQSGDFVLARQTSAGTTQYLIYYIYTSTINGTTEIVVLVDELAEINEFEQGENYAQGSHQGTFESSDQTIQLDYELSFTSQLVYDAELCQ